MPSEKPDYSKMPVFLFIYIKECWEIAMRDARANNYTRSLIVLLFGIHQRQAQVCSFLLRDTSRPDTSLAAGLLLLDN